MTTPISGLWLPLVTPFKDGAVDFASYERLIDHYIDAGVNGLFPLGTTGESPALDDDEVDALVERTVARAAGRVPVFAGVGSNATHKVEKTLRRLERFAFDGIVSVCPYYNRPSQEGLRLHFQRIAAATELKTSAISGDSAMTMAKAVYNLWYLARTFKFLISISVFREQKAATQAIARKKPIAQLPCTDHKCF